VLRCLAIKRNRHQKKANQSTRRAIDSKFRV
jgi:hypothetical protein